jgi:putative secretion ATPase (PEP-CTERM system associated)
MYERFYNLRERPFALSPDPDYLYLSRVHREALDSLRYGIESRAGFIVVTGEIGAGKTTLLQSLLRRVDDRMVVARLVNTTLDPRELLEAIALDFGLETTGKSKPVILRDLGQFLVQQRAQGRRPLLVVDEAQNLTAQGLEEIRLLSNLETEKSKLLQILLAGQPNLRDTIASPELEQFRQRVVVSYHLMPLDAPETAAYINSRLEHASNGAPLRFPVDAAELVHRRSGGVPRIINVICDAALVFGYAEERRHIDLALIRDVVAELEVTGILAAERAGRVAAPPAPALPKPGAAAVAVTDLRQAPDIRSVVPAASAPAAVAAAPPAQAAIGMPANVGEEALARAAQEAAQRASLLAGREQAIARRERELAEQRRVLAEEYRLLRNRRPAAPATPAGAGRARPASARGTRDGAHRRDGLLAWLKHLFSGGFHRKVEEKFGHLTRS